MRIEELSERLTDRENPVRVHLIGVAGSGMSGLALLLLGMGGVYYFYIESDECEDWIEGVSGGIVGEFEDDVSYS